ncbi:MAG: hypothetical protein MI923_12770 [Phycisphaerales bacterium]|nr:hypothetical protein [Phycisphaerales bacterium]
MRKDKDEAAAQLVRLPLPPCQVRLVSFNCGRPGRVRLDPLLELRFKGVAYLSLTTHGIDRRFKEERRHLSHGMQHATRRFSSGEVLRTAVRCFG